MQFHISRNGQTYGPYTREDLERYVSTGNVLPTDMGKSDAMAEWAPVSEILAGRVGQPQPPMQDPSSPFASQTGTDQTGFAQPAFNQPQQPAFNQPQLGQPAFNQPFGGPPAFGQPAGYPQQGGYGVLANTAYPDPPSMKWYIVLVIDFFTCGLFQMFWNLYISVWVAKLGRNQIPLICYAIGVVITFVSSGFSFVNLAHVHSSQAPFAPALTGGLGLLWIIKVVLKIVARYSFRNSLLAQYGPGAPENIALDVNPVMLFFFGGLYLQSHLSRIAELKAAARMNPMQPR